MDDLEEVALHYIIYSGIRNPEARSGSTPAHALWHLSKQGKRLITWLTRDGSPNICSQLLPA
jgi:hypothetical protein